MPPGLTMDSKVAIRRNKPEVMSPAGYWPQLQAAIEVGADAVYFGLKQFTARAKVGFEVAELPRVMEALRSRGVRGFVTVNTLVFERELRKACQMVEQIARAGADALIIQDLALAKLAREIAPEIEIHASTQMSITDAAGVRFAQSLGVDRVTLARELSLKEIRRIAERTEAGLEVFVHGALCVAYSGQCFSSEAWGGRSANRGQCAQACRLPYELIVDERVKPLGDARYLLSPGDLFALEQIPELIDIGIQALKIEGRYKDAEYVALTTGAYRTAVDEAWAGRQYRIAAEQRLQLEQVYSRGLGPHFLTGTNHQAVVEGRAPRHRGTLMGTVVSVAPDSVTISTAEAHRVSPLKSGDGVVFDAADWRSPQEREEGGRVYRTHETVTGLLQIWFGNGEISFERIRPGDRLWRSHDPELDRVARRLIASPTPAYRKRVNINVVARVGEPLKMEWILERSPCIRAVVCSTQTLEHAQHHAATESVFREQLGRLGNTPFELGSLESHIEGAPFVPSSLLNQLRRNAVEQLRAMLCALPDRRVQESGSRLDAALVNIGRQKPVTPRIPELHLLVRTPEQLDAAIRARPASITLDYLDLYGLKPSVERLRKSGLAVRIATPRILKPGEEKILRFLTQLGCPLLVRASGMIDGLIALGARELIGDFSLNAANCLSADMLLNRGLVRITPTHDLNAAQVTELAERIGPERIEAIAYQHLPVFHTEHCVFCRFLSTGTSFLDCGRPCEKHRVGLRDERGRVHPVLADVGCRNTVFGAEAQDASAYMDDWRRRGLLHFRIEFACESGAEVQEITASWRLALDDSLSWPELRNRLRRAAPSGLTEGSLVVPEGWDRLTVLQ